MYIDIAKYSDRSTWQQAHDGFKAEEDRAYERARDTGRVLENVGTINRATRKRTQEAYPSLPNYKKNWERNQAALRKATVETKATAPKEAVDPGKGSDLSRKEADNNSKNRQTGSSHEQGDSPRKSFTPTSLTSQAAKKVLGSRDPAKSKAEARERSKGVRRSRSRKNWVLNRSKAGRRKEMRQNKKTWKL